MMEEGDFTRDRPQAPPRLRAAQPELEEVGVAVPRPQRCPPGARSLSDRDQRRDPATRGGGSPACLRASRRGACRSRRAGFPTPGQPPEISSRGPRAPTPPVGFDRGPSGGPENVREVPPGSVPGGRKGAGDFSRVVPQVGPARHRWAPAPFRAVDQGPVATRGGVRGRTSSFLFSPGPVRDPGRVPGPTSDPSSGIRDSRRRFLRGLSGRSHPGSGGAHPRLRAVLRPPGVWIGGRSDTCMVI